MRVGTLTEEIFKCQNPLGLPAGGRGGGVVIHTEWCIWPLASSSHVVRFLKTNLVVLPLHISKKIIIIR